MAPLLTPLEFVSHGLRTGATPETQYAVCFRFPEEGSAFNDHTICYEGSSPAKSNVALSHKRSPPTRALIRLMLPFA
jgi:hypothetical protein